MTATLSVCYKCTVLCVSAMAAQEAIPFPRTDEFSLNQAENFWQMRDDATFTDFTILSGTRSFHVNIYSTLKVNIHKNV